MSNLAASIRGSLHPIGIDARGVSMIAKNTSCLRLHAMVIAGVDPNAVARDVFGLPDNSQQSSFALRQGNAFERAQYRNGAARLLQALRQAGILGTEDVRVLDLSQLPGSNSSSPEARKRARQRAIIETDRALRLKLARKIDAPNVIIQALLRLPLWDDGQEATVRPDVLIARSGAAMYQVGEIKSFPALRHLTDEQDVASAAAQCGVYGLALESTLRRLGSGEAVPTEAVLVLRKPGSFNSKPILQSIARDIATARCVLEQSPRSVQEIETVLGPDRALDTQANVRRLPAKFISACRSFCPIWQVCLDQSRQQGAPSLLGLDVEEVIGALNNTQRARELLRGAAPANELESDLQRRLLAYQSELRNAAG